MVWVSARRSGSSLEPSASDVVTCRLPVVGRREAVLHGALVDEVVRVVHERRGGDDVGDQAWGEQEAYGRVFGSGETGHELPLAAVGAAQCRIVDARVVEGA